jgi:hypothetical protein
MAKPAKAVLLAALVASAAAVLSGCIIWERPWWDQYPPRPATFYVYVYDYYSGMPVPWGEVELYQEDWWSWDYVGSWPVGPYGYTVVTGGFIGYDGCGTCLDESFRLVAFAQGYYTESVEISLSYYDASRTVRFYLAPWPLAREHEGERAPELGPGEGPPHRVKVEKAESVTAGVE